MNLGSSILSPPKMAPFSLNVKLIIFAEFIIFYLKNTKKKYILSSEISQDNFNKLKKLKICTYLKNSQ